MPTRQQELKQPSANRPVDVRVFFSQTHPLSCSALAFCACLRLCFDNKESMKGANTTNTTNQILVSSCSGFNGLSCIEDDELERVTFLIALAFFILVIAFLWLLACCLFKFAN